MYSKSGNFNVDRNAARHPGQKKQKTVKEFIFVMLCQQIKCAINL